MRPLRLISTITAGLAIAGVAVVAPDSPSDAAPLALETYYAGAGPLGPITVIGDSVLQGSVLYSPTLSDRLVERGWGPVRVRAGVGYNTGVFGGNTEAKATTWIERWRGAGWDPIDVVVNLGANDSGSCNTSITCARGAIMHVVDTIGPGHRIWWPKITRHPVMAHQQHTWNAALDQIAGERADFFTWDWPAALASGIPASADYTHLTAGGYRTRSALMATAITADLARGSQTGPAAPLPSPTSSPKEMLPIGPRRVLDTRHMPPGRVGAGHTIEVDVSKFVPADATAVAAYITAVAPSDNGYLSAQPCGRAPTSSFTNYSRGVNRGAVTITPVSTDKRFCVFTSATAHIVIDLQAAFVSDGLRFTPEATPKRLRDTRTSTAQRHLEIAAPPGADAVAVNITAVRAAGSGYATVHPCQTPVPTAANVNYLAGEVVASAAIVPVSPSGTICVDTSSLVDLVIDLTGAFTTDGDLGFVPVVPTRMLDTRQAIGGWKPIHGRGQVIEARVAPPQAQAVTGTMTLVAPLRTSYLQAWGCGGRVENSNVNALAGAVLANFVTTGTASGELCIFAIEAGHTLFDTTGWWIP
jgi:hypothetical protein